MPIRNSGTLGGNVANGSPIGDSMPVLIALAATVVLRRGSATANWRSRISIGPTRRPRGRRANSCAAIRVPNRREGLQLRAYKVSKRFDQDISAVFACFALSIRGGRIAGARIGCGGVGPIPMRAAATEAALAGQPWNDATAAAASQVLAGEFTPISDMRASAGFRRTVLGNLMRRFRLETSGTPVATRVDDPRLTDME